ncbi:hypothetical protein CHLNCDRAFT_136863 [Chlorella variabilis]|uniref:Xanthine/uracil/vitamin C permease n=1 Tax=Chlorella variabilis TaxID=554065 RepID=E1ZL76_CHLVA|nr:hypothetical protein CHLNCDRAFT_136863 [Chlorella variabilis]EFN53511.1 hypothetical protein CHLNCDRAFT_136863 [Chlorella variabilis]|eukprot:XP_005845613.1 hypothetical protein CHLNCDRAFT_136863 [Chlorella variabilis]
MTLKERVDRYFKVSERGSNVGREIKSGVVTFMTASYILLVNPQILGLAGLPVKAVVTATALSSMLASLLCGLMSNLPVGISPGMGLNAYLVFSQVVGMGLLLTFIGLQTSKIVVAAPETMVTMGDLFALEPLLAIGGLAVISALHYRNVKGSIIIGVLLVALAYFAAKGAWPTECAGAGGGACGFDAFVALPHLKFFALDFSELLAFKPSAWSAVLAYTLVMIFDIGGAMFGLGNLAGLVRDGHVPGAVWTYLAASAGTALGALTGTTPLIIAAESAVGIKEGGRTGLVAVTVAGCFAVSMLLSPFLQAIPQLATAPVLVLVGAMMMGESTHIDWSSMLTAVPAFLTIVIQPFTFSIANGIYAGLTMSVLLFFLTGQFLEVFRGAKGEGGDLETPLLGGSDGGGGADEEPNGHVPGADTPRLPPLPGVAEGGQAIPIGAALRRNLPHEVAALVGSLTGSLRSRGSAPYQRNSYTMYINVAGSGAGTTPSVGSGARSSRAGSDAPHGGSDLGHHLDH